MRRKLGWAELRHFVIQAFCRFDWFVSIVALHTTWQSIWCAAHVWTNLDRCAVIRLFTISWWAGTQMPWCETGTKLKRKCPYLDDKMNTFPFQGWPLAATVLISYIDHTISWWAGTQMPWCETGTKLKRKCPYLDDKMNTFPFQGWSLAATVLISYIDHVKRYVYLPWTSFACYTKDNQQGCFRLSNWFSLRRLGPWMNHLPPAW